MQTGQAERLVENSATEMATLVHFGARFTGKLLTIFAAADIVAKAEIVNCVVRPTESTKSRLVEHRILIQTDYRLRIGGFCRVGFQVAHSKFDHRFEQL